MKIVGTFKKINRNIIGNYSYEDKILINSLFEKKFLKYSNEKVVANKNISRMFERPKHVNLKKDILKRTYFLDINCSVYERLVCIYHNLYDYPRCRFCGKISNFDYPLSFGYKETCGEKICVNKFGVENRGGLQYSVGKHIITDKGRLGMANAGKKRIGLRKGKTWAEVLGSEEKAEQLKELISFKNSGKYETGWCSPFREEILNPFTKKNIVLMSSYEKEVFDFFIKNNIWFDSCHARIKYYNPVNLGYRYYNPDFIVKNDNYYMIEVKPLNFLIDTEYSYNIVSRAKIEKLYNFCLEKKRICLIFTENEIYDEEKMLKLVLSGKSNFFDYMG